MQLSRVTIPALIVSHRNDACDLTPATGAYKLKQKLTGSAKVEIAILEGGSPPQSEPCEAMSQHGFLGIEDEAVGTIVKFVKAHGSNGAQ